MSEEAKVLESVESGSQPQETLDVTVAEPKETEFDETDVSEFEGDTISKDAFLKRLSKSKEKRLAEASSKAELEQKLKSYEWADNFSKILEANPEYEKEIMQIIQGKKVDKQETQEEDDEVTQLRKKIESIEKGSQAKIFKAYERAFQEETKEYEKDPLLRGILRTATETILNTKFKEWREGYDHALISKAYKEARAELNKLFTKEKRDYIESKTNSDSPEIGKGLSGAAVDEVPYGDETKMNEFISKFMKGD